MKQNYVDIGFGEAADLTGIDEIELRACAVYSDIGNGVDLQKSLRENGIDEYTYKAYESKFNKIIDEAVANYNNGIFTNI